MFFEPQFWQKERPATLSNQASVEGAQGYPSALLKQLVAQRGSREGSIVRLRLEEGLPEGMQVETGEETYALVITGEEAVLYGASPRALIYAAQTLRQMSSHEGIFTGRLEDAPDCAFRGYRAYLPGPDSFQDFYNMVDTISYYKYNYISLEIGGAMEYKRHPEINAAWKEFAADTHRYSGRTCEIQNGYPWAKNSIHTDNGEGEILTQEQVRGLIAYCRERGLEVYPEVPLLSHSDYICLAHPELREREEDPYPDTYCPNHPDTYPIVFDILEEVIDVFQPKLINIGHDEYYSMCLCPRCKGKKPEEVFAADITKIHDFLAQRGIRTMMWGDKLLPVVTQDFSYGGAGVDRISPEGVPIQFPPIFRCQQLLPKDILMANWYFSFGIQYDFVYHTQGYEMIYGNMAAEQVEYWRERRNFGAKGGFCSNWGSNYPEYMQRNGQYLHLIFGAFALWSKTYCNRRQQEILEKTFEEAFHLHYGNLEEKPYIVVCHTTDLEIPYKVFYDGIFIEDEIYHMGCYKLTYTDGTTAMLEVKYGTNIASSGIPCSLGDSQKKFNPISLDETALGELSYSTIPFWKKGKTWYKTAYANPYPEKTICAMEYLPDRPERVEILSVCYQ